MTYEEMMIEKVDRLIKEFRAGKISMHICQASIASEVVQMQRLRYKAERDN